VDAVDSGGETDDALDDDSRADECTDDERVTGRTGVEMDAGNSGRDDGASGVFKPPMASIRPRPVTPSRMAPTTSLTASVPEDAGSGLRRAFGEGEVSEGDPTGILLAARDTIRSHFLFSDASSASC